MVETSLAPSDPPDELASFRREARKQRLRLLGVVGLGVALLGLIPIPFGAGYFGWRIVRFDRVALYLLNTTDGPVTVTVGDEEREVGPRAVGSVPFRAGSAHVAVRDEAGALLHEQGFDSDNQDIFYNPFGTDCFGVVDASRLYTPGRERSDNPYRVIHAIAADEVVYAIPSSTFLPPGSIPPETVPGGVGVTWIERGGCALVEEGNEHLFLGQLQIRLESRRARRDAAEERRQRLLGGGGAP